MKRRFWVVVLLAAALGWVGGQTWNDYHRRAYDDGVLAVLEEKAKHDAALASAIREAEGEYRDWLAGNKPEEP